jgi:hypothetical protein
MEPIKVFLSSTYRDRELRETAIETIRSLPGFAPVLVEETEPSATIERAVSQKVMAADVMVLIVGASLGTRTREGSTFVEMEYAAARRAGKPAIVMMLGERSLYNAADDQRSKQDLSHLIEFRRQLLDTSIVGMFDSSAELSDKLRDALLNVAQERFGPTFNITFDPELSEDQVRAAFAALSDYYRACGGIGLQVDFEREQVQVGDLQHV